eukprot:CAMPEP_0118869868 /NCGR_PEP_ID=MMETSP1163-20130328/13008_1 /TAXON_ID=124430 /ORGANISM="Phaeomonas parva, Strain CCMP2877" /LENGTH=358 /DNA_ID=CAMNT_0006804803 /DNA_START=148 /DNA_END=1224 /DNA_ORIENTATION=-
MAEVSEEALDRLEVALTAKLETLCGYRGEAAMRQKLEATFRYFDADDSGEIDFPEFFAAMVRLNFVGVQREVEALFDRYDEDCSGTLDYREFTKYLGGGGSAGSEASASAGVVERVKQALLDRGVLGIRSAKQILRRMDKDGSHTLDVEELREGLRQLPGLGELSDDDADKLMVYFDRDKSGKVSIEEFLRGVRGRMKKKRVLLVAQAFNVMDRTGDGVVTIEDLQGAYDASRHPKVLDGSMTEDEALVEVLNVYDKNDGDGLVTWQEFLDYYKDISAGIDADDYFELMIRNAWHISGGKGDAQNSSCRRVLVVHGDGSQEVVEIKNDIGIAANDMAGMRKRLLEQGVQDISEIHLSG